MTLLLPRLLEVVLVMRSVTEGAFMRLHHSVGVSLTVVALFAHVPGSTMREAYSRKLLFPRKCYKRWRKMTRSKEIKLQGDTLDLT
jgi:hypothetical protein